MQYKNESTSFSENTEWTAGLALSTCFTGKQNNLNCELKGKGKSAADLISDTF